MTDENASDELRIQCSATIGSFSYGIEAPGAFDEIDAVAPLMATLTSNNDKVLPLLFLPPDPPQSLKMIVS